MLSLLLSQHPQIANFGQIRDVFLAHQQQVECSCGARLCDCPIWGGLVARAPSEGRRLGQLDTAEVAGLYRTAFDALGTSVAVDSSKSADLLRQLAEGQTMDLYCLNLIRDPRAVAVSWSKTLGRPQAVAGRCENWVARQRRIEKLFQGRPEGLMQLRYEDLTRDPQRAVAAIQRWVGVDDDLGAFAGQNAAHINWKGQHLFPPANATVLRQRAPLIRIEEATAWRAPAAKPVRDLATKLCFPFAARYEYCADLSDHAHGSH